MNNDETYIHYGADHFDKRFFNAVMNDVFPSVKPLHGGLWASPIDSNCSWNDFCKNNEYELDKLGKYFQFKLTDDSKVMFIDSNYKLDKLVSEGFCKNNGFTTSRLINIGLYYLDFEKIANFGYDAILVFINYETYMSLYGWDCDTLLVLNPDCVIEVE